MVLIKKHIIRLSHGRFPLVSQRLYYRGQHTVITVIPIDTLTKFFPRKEIDNLRENSLALVHNEFSFHTFLCKRTMKPGLMQIQIVPF